jgi:hypothetical protein
MAVGISYQTAFAFNQEWFTVEFELRDESERFQDLNRHVNTLSHNPFPVGGPLRERLSHQGEASGLRCSQLVEQIMEEYGYWGGD